MSKFLLLTAIRTSMTMAALTLTSTSPTITTKMAIPIWLTYKPDFSSSDLVTHLTKTETVLCAFTGSDIHLTSSIIDASSRAGVKLFIPSEYSLDTSNPKIRELLPPYQTRLEI
jgi:NmrA-like family